MKNLYVWTAIITFLVSCSPDYESQNQTEQQQADESYLQKVTGKYPENNANEYDDAGQLYYEISEEYLANNYNEATVAGIIVKVEDIAGENADFVSLKPSNYTSPLPARIQYILNNQYTSMLEIIGSPRLGLSAKLSLADFINQVMIYKSLNVDYEILYEYIIDYEAEVLEDSSLSSTDRKTILITSSITRFAFYFASKHKKKPRDKDWDISWGNIVAGTDGEEESLAKAIVMSAVTGIKVN